ncbi:hypothetical protein A3184_09120 [Salmonella enterica subsp. enterica serovar Typhimurium]|nr:hypothetical protein [Salmonella enterica subsp. enterica serovar Typhimurium var. 5-]ECS3625143.1 hypothetical protein [Salmonella enterica subsp. enterica serovar Typhimurium]
MMRGFLRFKNDISESALSPITRTYPDTLAHSWRLGRAFYTKENPALWLGFVRMGARGCANNLLPFCQCISVTNKSDY